jgi:hypothetical protein
LEEGGGGTRVGYPYRIVPYHTFTTTAHVRNYRARTVHTPCTVRYMAILVRLAARRRSTCMIANLHRTELSIPVVNSVRLGSNTIRTVHCGARASEPQFSLARARKSRAGSLFGSKMLDTVRYGLKMDGTDSPVWMERRGGDNWDQ